MLIILRGICNTQWFLGDTFACVWLILSVFMGRSGSDDWTAISQVQGKTFNLCITSGPKALLIKHGTCDLPNESSLLLFNYYIFLSDHFQ